MKYPAKKRIANFAARLARIALINTPPFTGKREKADKTMCRRILVLLGICATALVSAPHLASRHNHLACASAAATNAFGCRDGATRSCTTSTGKPGERVCAGGRFGACVPLEADPPPTPGRVHPKYYILTVIYSPPGTQGGGSSSSVSYGSGSTAGSTVSATSSFKAATSVSVTATGGWIGSATLGASFDYSMSKSDSQSLDITKSASTEITAFGPSQDGIDHDRDEIWLWLNPTVELSLTPSSASWNLKSNPQADIQKVYVGWLKDPSKMQRDAPGVVQRLQTYGITTQDYAEILKADPPASGTIVVRRFESLNTTFPYEPPYAPGDQPSTLKFAAEYRTDESSSRTTQLETSVGASIEGGFSFTTLVKGTFKYEDKWTWTNTNTFSGSTGTTLYRTNNDAEL